MRAPAPRSRPDRLDLLLVAAAALALATFVRAEQRIAGAPGLPLDDGWIHLRLAQNLARGAGFAINPGEPVAASTAPLWTVVLGIALAAGAPGLAAAKALGGAAFLGTGLLTRRVAAGLGLPTGVALAAGIAAVGVGRLVWGALSGMEVPLAAALVAAAALAQVHGRPGLAAGGLGLAALARPEAALLAVLHAAAGRRPREIGRRLARSAVVVAPALAFNYWASQRLLPATAAAKVEGGLLGHAEGLAGAWPAAAGAVGPFLSEWVAILAADHMILPVLAAAGLGMRRLGPLRWWAAALVLQPVAMALVAPYRGPAFQTGRYTAHLVPLALVAGAVAVERGLARLPWRPGRALVWAALAAALIVRLPASAEAYAWGVQNINAMQVRLGRWVAANTPPNTLVALNDLGALSYFGDRPVVDLVGLGTPEALPYRRRGGPGILEYLARRCPEYLIVFPNWFPDVVVRRDLFREVARVTLARNVVAGGPTMVVYETAWHRGRGAARAACPAPPG